MDSDGNGLKAFFENDIKLKLKASYLILLQNVAEDPGSDADGRFEKIRECVRRFAFDGDVLSLAAENVAELASEIKAGRETVIEALGSLRVYYKYMHIVSDLALREKIRRGVTENHVPDNPGSLFVAHMEKLMGTEIKPKGKAGPPEIDAKKISASMSFIPLRMTTAKYFDYIRDALAQIEDGQGESAEGYKESFCPMDYAKDDSFFPELRQKLDEFWEAEAPADAEALVDKPKSIYVMYIDKFNKMLALFDATGAANIICMFGPRYGQLLIDGRIDSFREKIRELAEGKLDGDDAAKIIAEINAATDEAIEAIRAGSIGNGPEGKSFPLNLPEDLKGLYDDWVAVDGLFYESAVDHYSGASKKTSEDASAETLCDFIKRCGDALPVEKRRFLRQHFLSCLPYPYGLDEYKKYFTETYDSLDAANRVFMEVCLTETPAEGEDGGAF
ncbi:MAG: hypothetical protein FWF03_03710 [Defluviitaleaceae bacterium]|nr:hypothetical protein [Defluviitaleaceae bacterium]